MIDIAVDASASIELGIGSRHYCAEGGIISVDPSDVASAKDHLRVAGWLQEEPNVVSDESITSSEESANGTV
jgi:septum formation inhibitor-activating ATPase MinD